MGEKVVTSCEDVLPLCLEGVCFFCPLLLQSDQKSVNREKLVFRHRHLLLKGRTKKVQGKKETEKKGSGFPRCYSKYRKVTQACNNLNNVKYVLFSKNATFHPLGCKAFLISFRDQFERK